MKNSALLAPVELSQRLMCDVDTGQLNGVGKYRCVPSLGCFFGIPLPRPSTRGASTSDNLDRRLVMAAGAAEQRATQSGLHLLARGGAYLLHRFGPHTAYFVVPNLSRRRDAYHWIRHSQRGHMRGN